MATFSLLVTGVNGAMFYLIPLIPSQGVQGFLVVFLEGFLVWVSTEEKAEATAGVKSA